MDEIQARNTYFIIYFASRHALGKRPHHEYNPDTGILTINPGSDELRKLYHRAVFTDKVLHDLEKRVKDAPPEGIYAVVWDPNQKEYVDLKGLKQIEYLHVPPDVALEERTEEPYQKSHVCMSGVMTAH